MKKPTFFKNKDEATGNARLFEDVIYKKDLLMKRVSIGIGVLGSIFGLLSIIALINMLPLKTTELKVFSVDNQTGRVEEITTVTNSTLSDSEALSRYFTDVYIKTREGYNYFRLQQDYDLVMLYSSDAVANEYNAIFKSNDKPQNVYRKGERTAKVEVLSKIITNSSRENDPDKLASIRFKKTITDVMSNTKRDEYWTARMTFQFVPDNELTKEERDVNPLGFVVTSYLTEQENRG